MKPGGPDLVTWRLEAGVPTDSSQPGDVLLGATLLLARSADLPSRLHGLAVAAVKAVDGRGAIMYLLDPDSGGLQPVAGS